MIISLQANIARSVEKVNKFLLIKFVFAKIGG